MRFDPVVTGWCYVSDQHTNTTLMLPDNHTFTMFTGLSSLQESRQLQLKLQVEVCKVLPRLWNVKCETECKHLVEVKLSIAQKRRVSSRSNSKFSRSHIQKNICVIFLSALRRSWTEKKNQNLIIFCKEQQLLQLPKKKQVIRKEWKANRLQMANYVKKKNKREEESSCRALD